MIMTQDDIKPGEQLTLAQINWLRKQAQAQEQGKAESGSGGGEKLRQDGPTVGEFVQAGYKASDYPPKGYASKSTDAEISDAIATQKKADEDEPETDPLKMKVDDLKAWLTSKGIEFPTDAKKDDLKALVPAE
jgi:hypothetical protein